MYGLLAFLLSLFGLSSDQFARALIIVLFIGAGAAIVVRRPPASRHAAAALGVCACCLVIVGWPMHQFGLDWIANANDDMANYVLSATHLTKHGLLGPIDVAGVRHARDFSSLLQILHNLGSRPGSDIVLASVSSALGRAPYQMFMPTIIAFLLCLVTATGALAMQAARRAWVGLAAVALAVVASLIAYGALQQLMAQVWGLAVAVTLVAWLFQQRLHRAPGPRGAEIVVIALLVACFVVSYVELAALIAPAYAFYVLYQVGARRFDWEMVMRLWIPVLLITAAILNRYLIREIDYVRGQAMSGSSPSSTAAPLFGYSLVPAALSAVWGLKLLPASTSDRWLGLSIAVAIVLSIALIVFALRSLPHDVAPAFVVVLLALVGVYLFARHSDFGLFKLYMYAQPFIIALAALALDRARRRSLLAIGLLAGALLVLLNLNTTVRYVHRSVDPIDLPDASAPDLLPQFRQAVDETSQPVVSVTDSPVLGKLEAAGMDDRPLNFITSYIFKSYSRFTAEQAGWHREAFPLLDGSGRSDPFLVNPRASQLLLRGRCLLVLPSGTTTVLNRLQSPAGGSPIDFTTCRGVRDTLIFTSSKFGSTFSEPPLETLQKRSLDGVAFFQPERDYFYPGQTFVGFGRYTLMRVVSAAPRIRVLVDMTRTQLRAAQRLVPPVAVVGTTRVLFHVVGRGSARLVSPWVTPRTIDGARYVLLDLGAKGILPPVPRKGLAALYGRSVPLDPRYLTAFVRDISLTPSKGSDPLVPPRGVPSFPAGLADPGLQYSGFYEDGWVGEDSYLDLACGRAATLEIRANVPPGITHQHLSVSVSGRPVVSQDADSGRVTLRAPIPACAGERTVQFHWSSSRVLPEPDGRIVSAQVLSVGVSG